MAKNLGDFISQLKELFPDDVLEIKRTINPDNYDATAILEHLDKANRFPLVHFKSAKNLLGEESEYSLVSNVFGTRERCATILDLPRDQSKMPLSIEFARREKLRMTAENIAKSDAPVKEIVEVDDQVDLRKLPMVRHYEMDLGPYITMAVVMRDPDEGFYDVSFVKSVYKGPRKLGTVRHSPHIDRIFAKYEKRGEPVPIINVLGHHPGFYLGTLALAPWGTNDYDAIGAYLGEPLRLTPSETWGDKFMVPADAELIIEGVMPPGVREIANPFGEVTRHYQAQCLSPITDVTAVTHRRGAKMQDIFSGHQGHWSLGGIPKEGSIYNALQRKYPNVKAVHLPDSGCGRFSCYVSIDKRHEGEAKAVALEVLTSARQFQWVVIVDDDVDVFNERDVVWAVVTATNPKRDISYIENVSCSFITAMGHSKVIVDATRPHDIAFPSVIKVPDAAMERIKLEEWIN
ncbi:MAG: UbiD family decarboxylase [Chloroflexi bacterium]|nr:UbiD family decarboxylase [Chloroflexota bacterium]